MNSFRLEICLKSLQTQLTAMTTLLPTPEWRVEIGSKCTIYPNSACFDLTGDTKRSSNVSCIQSGWQSQ